MGIAFGQTGILRRIEAGIHTSEDREMTARGEGQVAFVPEAFRVFGVRRQHFIQNLGHGTPSIYEGMVSIANMGPKLFWGPPGVLYLIRPTPFLSISPEILEPIRRERRVANRRSNRPVAKIVLDRSGVAPIVGQLVAARVAQHMAADLEREARRLASTRNHALVTCHAQGR